MSIRMLSCIVFISLLLAACGGGASLPATQLPPAEPSPGARYSGPIEMGDKAKEATIAFQIARDGTTISALELSFTELKCEGFSAGESFKREVAIYPINAGKFEFSSNSFGDVSGAFTSPEAASGTIELKLDTGFGGPPVDCGSATFEVKRVPGESASAPAEPIAEPTQKATDILPTPTEIPVTAPQPGASFGGLVTLKDQPGSAMLTFQVSEDGASISKGSLMLMGLQCGEFNTGMTILQTTSSIPLEEGKFKGNLSSIGEIEGEFSLPTIANGQVHLLLDFGLGGEPIECGVGEFNAMIVPQETQPAPGETQAAPTEPAAAAPASPPSLLTPIDLPAGDIAVVNDYSSEDDENIYILGEVENRTSGFIQDIHVNAVIFDAGGSQVAEADERSQYDELPPGERAPFIITIPKPASYASFSLTVTSKPGGESAPAELRIVDQVVERDQYGYMQAGAIVENGTPENLQYVLVIGVFYDTEGRVIGVGSNFPAGPDTILAAGKRSSVSFTPQPLNMGDFADYRLIVANNHSAVDPVPPELETGIVMAEGAVIHGQLTFPGPGGASLPIMWAATYDDLGKLIEIAMGYVEPDPLEPGVTGTFMIELLHPDYATYELYGEYFLE